MHGTSRARASSWSAECATDTKSALVMDSSGISTPGFFDSSLVGGRVCGVGQSLTPSVLVEDAAERKRKPAFVAWAGLVAFDLMCPDLSAGARHREAGASLESDGQVGPSVGGGEVHRPLGQQADGRDRGAETGVVGVLGDAW